MTSNTVLPPPTQLEAGAVFYEHQMPEEPFWVVRDSIMLLLSSPPAPAVHHVLPITVSYYAANRNVSSQLWRNKGGLGQLKSDTCLKYFHLNKNKTGMKHEQLSN